MSVKIKKGQVAIFIIVGIVIVVGIIMAIYFTGKVDVDSPVDLTPKSFVDKCVRDSVEISIEKMLSNGGEISPSQAISYQGSEWNYLCYQADFYQGCYNIHPMLEVQIEKEIEKDTQIEVQGCFNSMREDFENRGFSVGGGATTYSIDLLPGYVAINLIKNIDISKEGVSQNFEDFNTKVPSPIYDLVQVSRDIVNSESRYCNFEYSGYMLLYPKYDIKKISYDNNKLYSIIDRKSKFEFKFATRSCAFPPGI